MLQNLTYETLDAQGHVGWGYHGRVFRTGEHEAVKLYAPSPQPTAAVLDAYGLCLLQSRQLRAATPYETGWVWVRKGQAVLPAYDDAQGKEYLKRCAGLDALPALHREWVQGRVLGTFMPTYKTITQLERYFTAAAESSIMIADYKSSNFVLQKGTLVCVDGNLVREKDAKKDDDTFYDTMEQQLDRCIAHAFRSAGASRARMLFSFTKALLSKQGKVL